MPSVLQHLMYLMAYSGDQTLLVLCWVFQAIPQATLLGTVVAVGVTLFDPGGTEKKKRIREDHKPTVCSYSIDIAKISLSLFSINSCHNIAVI